jgi:hypothetical protein
MPEAKFGRRNEFGGLLTGQNETQAVHGSTGRAYRLSYLLYLEARVARDPPRIAGWPVFKNCPFTQKGEQ